jgi:HD-GYP domain-containing protein (c-di-GMP phosphodiesterase class II)
MQEISSEELIEKLRTFQQEALVYTTELKKIAELESVKKKELLEESYKKFEKIYHETIRALAATIDAKSKYIRGHSERVRRYAELIGERLYLTEDEMKRLSLAATLHDIGRVTIENQIWDKPEPLTQDEYSKVKEHPTKSAEFLKHVEFLAGIIDIIKHHHERYDGKGYPGGLAGEDIPLESRILAVADAYDAMLSERPYREKKTQKEAIEELQKESGKQFDPMVVDAFISIIKKEKGI